MNKVKLLGLASNLSYHHTKFGEKYYLCYLSVNRESNTVDKIPIMVSEKLIIPGMEGNDIYVEGEYRSYNLKDKDKTRLMLYVFAQEVYKADEGDYNGIILGGFICKKPILRKTPLGRTICDLLIATNRQYGKSDYIPCIAWGRNAVMVSGVGIGDHIQIDGRIQSREYIKDDSTHIAYEVSIKNIYL